jgi:hypothetical protein
MILQANQEGVPMLNGHGVSLPRNTHIGISLIAVMSSLLPSCQTTAEDDQSIKTFEEEVLSLLSSSQTTAENDQSPRTFEEEASKLIERNQSASSNDRIIAIQSLGRLIAIPRRSSSFSKGWADTPQEDVSKPMAIPPKKVFPETVFLEVVDTLGTAAHDPIHDVREEAAKAFCDIDVKAPGVAEAIAKALSQQDDTSVIWYVCQAMWSDRPNAKVVLPPLLEILKNGGQARQHAVRAIGLFENEAKGAIPTLVQIAVEDPDEMTRYIAINALQRVGLNESGAKTLCEMQVKVGIRECVFFALAHQPKWALAYLRKHPGMLEEVYNPWSLIKIIERPDPALNELKEYLLKRPDLPLEVMAYTQNPEYLPNLVAQVKLSSGHILSKLKACTRACGMPPDRIVTISEKQPGDFKPESAWPGTVASRTSPKGGGHGDGFTWVIITGQIAMSDGSPAIAPRFYETNGRMLMGERTDDLARIKYDDNTGRFLFLTSVFAAYSMGEGQSEPGPFQTGSAQVRIEAKNAKPLVVQFYDEMPDVKIILSPAE